MKKRVVIQLLIVVAISVCLYLGNFKKDHFAVMFAADRFELFEDGTYISAAQTLDVGTYQLTLSYASPSQHTLSVFTKLSAGENNQLERTYMQVLLPVAKDGGTAEHTIALDSPGRYLQFKIAGDNDFVIDGLTIKSEDPIYRDALFWSIGLLIIGAVFICLNERTEQRKNQMNLQDKRDFILASNHMFAFCFLLGLASSLFLMGDSLPSGHDLPIHLERIEGIFEGLRDGQFPVRINPIMASEYGYAIPIMYPDLFLYIPAVLRFCGISLMTSYQAFILLINVATAFISYHCFARLCGSAMIGAMGSALYTFSLYRLTNVYTRAALGELLAMVFLPCVILGVYEVCCRDPKEYKWLVIGATGVLSSHIITTELCVLGCGVFALVNCKRIVQRERFVALTKSVALTLLISFWYIVPFLSFARADFYVYHQEVPVEQHAVYFSQLFATFVSSRGGSNFLGNTVGEMPLSIGGILGVGALVYLFGRYQKRTFREGDNDLEKIGMVSLAFSLASLLVASVLFPWKAIREIPVLGNFLAAIQFPWRYLSLASVFLCIVCALAIYRFAVYKSKKFKINVMIGAAALSIAAAAPYLCDFAQNAVALFHSKYDAPSLTIVEYLYFYKDTDINGLRADLPVIHTSTDAIKFENYIKDGTNIMLDYQYVPRELNSEYVELPLFYYPGYGAVLGGSQKLVVGAGRNNLLRIYLPFGETAGHITVSYVGLWYFRVADIISLLTILSLCVHGVLQKLRRQKDPKGHFNCHFVAL